MGVIVSSIFRDAAEYVDRYVDQVAALRELLGVPVRLVVAEGDSTDDTYTQLVVGFQKAEIPAVVLRVDHHGPKFGSYDVAQRWRQIAQVCNAVMDRVRVEIEDDDLFCYVESDLVWAPDTIAALFDGLEVAPAIAPMSFHGPTGMFWDTWGHIGLDGKRFSNYPPYHPSVNGQRVQIQSAGSCFVMRGRLAKQVRFSPEDCIRGVGRTIREAGGSLWLDPSVKVIQP